MGLFGGDASNTSSSSSSAEEDRHRACPRTPDSTLSQGEMLLSGGEGARDSLTVEGYSATMQSDGNLVVATSSGEVLWASGTEGDPEAGPFSLVLSEEGKLTIQSADGTELWACEAFHRKADLVLVEGNLKLQNGNKNLWTSPDP